MKTLTRPIVKLILLTALPLAALAEVAVQEHIPADTKIVGKIRIADAMGSRVVSDILDVCAEQYGTLHTFMSENVGVDITAIETAWFLVPRPDAGVVILQGQFDQAAIRTRFMMIPGVSQLFREDCAIAARFHDEKKGTVQMGALLDEATLAIGDEECVTAFLDARQGRIPTIPAAHQGLRRLTQDDSTLVLTALAPATEWPNADPNIARLVDTAYFRLQIAENARATLSVSTRRAQDPQALSFLLQGLALLKANDPALARQPLLKGALASMMCRTKDNVLAVSTEVSGQDIQMLLASRN